MSAKAYLVVDVRVSDAVAYEGYKALAQAAVAEFGGRYLVRGGPAELLEGKEPVPQRLAIIEFDSVEQAKLFYHSPTYRVAREARAGAAEMNMLVVEGVNNLL